MLLVRALSPEEVHTYVAGRYRDAEVLTLRLPLATLRQAVAFNFGRD